MKKRLVFLVGLLVGLFVFFVLTNSLSANGLSPKPKKITPAKLEEKIAKLEVKLRAGLDSLKKQEAALQKDHDKTKADLKKLEKKIAVQVKKLNILEQQKNTEYFWLMLALIIGFVILFLTLLFKKFRVSRL